MNQMNYGQKKSIKLISFFRKFVVEIIILTTKLNNAWTSMEEIIPGLEESWRHCLENEKFSYKIINVDQQKPVACLKLFLSAQKIIITAFNAQMAYFMKVIRSSYSIDAPFIFHLHGLASIGCWPLERFGVMNLLREDDLFIGTCSADKKCIDLTFENAHTEIVPFPLINFQKNDLEETQKGFVYVGRISPQKNLHLLIRAYANLDKDLQDDFPLIIYGKEDHLGFPNLGIEVFDYYETLQKLIVEFDLVSRVIFKGFVAREIIQREVGKHHIFISLSTHSDENFGMAALRALTSGCRTILTSWGGHKEFFKIFPDLLSLVPVSITNNGPQFSLTFVTNLMKKMCYQQAQLPVIPAVFNFTIESIALSFKPFLKREGKQNKIRPTDVCINVCEQQKKFESNDQIQRCFSTSDDYLLQCFLLAYAES
jgi:glycosyltransferase involved in cell wall biosynthesis